jgi:hypothetical protein
LETLYGDNDLKDVVPFADFSATMKLVGNAYGFKPGKLRLNDSFTGVLKVADSALLGDAPEILWESISKRYPFLSAEDHFHTIEDLLIAVGKGARGER